MIRNDLAAIEQLYGSGFERLEFRPYINSAAILTMLSLNLNVDIGTSVNSSSRNTETRQLIVQQGPGCSKRHLAVVLINQRHTWRKWTETDHCRTYNWAFPFAPMCWTINDPSCDIELRVAHVTRSKSHKRATCTNIMWIRWENYRGDFISRDWVTATG
jgi:hypothetical protein